MNRLEQDAADALRAYEFQQAERARWARAQPQKIVRTWAPELSAQDFWEREQQIKAGTLPF